MDAELSTWGFTDYSDGDALRLHRVYRSAGRFCQRPTRGHYHYRKAQVEPPHFISR
jgi:hypothetical protein